MPVGDATPNLRPWRSLSRVAPADQCSLGNAQVLGGFQCRQDSLKGHGLAPSVGRRRQYSDAGHVSVAIAIMGIAAAAISSYGSMRNLRRSAANGPIGTRQPASATTEVLGLCTTELPKAHRSRHCVLLMRDLTHLGLPWRANAGEVSTRGARVGNGAPKRLFDGPAPDQTPMHGATAISHAAHAVMHVEWYEAPLDRPLQRSKLVI